jgi:lambda repressor-like predicted transcriptional regulator
MSIEDAKGIAPQGNLRLKARMDQQGMTIEKLAHVSGVSVRSIKRYLRGENPRRGEAKQVADALDCELHELWPDKFPVFPAQFGDRRGQRVRQPGRCPDQRVEAAL